MIIFREEKKKATFKEAINYINSNMGKTPVYKDWYVGITKNLDERLFGFHNVDRYKAGWIYVVTESSDTARTVEKYFIEKLNTDGGSGGGDDDSDIVYVYKKTNYTIER